MACAHDAGSDYRAAQAGICGDPRTHRRRGVCLPDLRRLQTEAMGGRRDPKRKTKAGRVIGMGRTEAKSGLVAKRPMAATSGASSPRDVSVLSIVADLEGRDLDGLRRQWRAHLRGAPPAHLPPWPLVRVLVAYADQ